jgi:arabinofuranosyltransferase
MFISMLLGFSPAYLWLIFSIIYFGFPFPNTYYAKLEFGYVDIVIKTSINFLYAALMLDSISVLVILGSLIFAFVLFSWQSVLYACSILLYLVYLLFTGGDFMGTRFLSTPLVIAVIFISYFFPKQTQSPKSYILIPLGVMLFFFNYFNIHAPWKYFAHHQHYVKLLPKVPQVFYLPKSQGQIFFDKIFYFKPSNILFYSYIAFPFEKFLHVSHAGKCRSMPETAKQIHIAFGGMDGVCYGAKHILVDGYALTEPLLARLPVRISQQGFAVAHIWYDFPKGLMLSYRKNQNLLADKELAKYYDKILTVTRGEGTLEIYLGVEYYRQKI